MDKTLQHSYSNRRPIHYQYRSWTTWRWWMKRAILRWCWCVFWTGAPPPQVWCGSSVRKSHADGSATLRRLSWTSPWPWLRCWPKQSTGWRLERCHIDQTNRNNQFVAVPMFSCNDRSTYLVDTCPAVWPELTALSYSLCACCFSFTLALYTLPSISLFRRTTFSLLPQEEELSIHTALIRTWESQRWMQCRVARCGKSLPATLPTDWPLAMTLWWWHNVSECRIQCP